MEDWGAKLTVYSTGFEYYVIMLIIHCLKKIIVDIKNTFRFVPQ